MARPPDPLDGPAAAPRRGPGSRGPPRPGALDGNDGRGTDDNHRHRVLHLDPRSERLPLADPGAGPGRRRGRGGGDPVVAGPCGGHRRGGRGRLRPRRGRRLVLGGQHRVPGGGAVRRQLLPDPRVDPGAGRGPAAVAPRPARPGGGAVGRGVGGGVHRGARLPGAQPFRGALCRSHCPRPRLRRHLPRTRPGRGARGGGPAARRPGSGRVLRRRRRPGRPGGGRRRRQWGRRRAGVRGAERWPPNGATRAVRGSWPCPDPRPRTWLRGRCGHRGTTAS